MLKPTFQDQFRSARRAGAPLLNIRTADAWSAMEQIKRALADKFEQTPVAVWDIMRALQGYNTVGIRMVNELLAGGDPAQVASAPPEMLDRISRVKLDDCIFVMFNAQSYWEGRESGAVVRQAIWNLREIYKQKGNMLVMFTPLGTKLPAELADDVLVIDEPLPTPVELREILEGILKSAEVNEASEEDKTKWVDAVAGLAAFPAETALAMSVSKAKKTMDLDLLWSRKVQAIEQQPGLTVYKGQIDEPVGLDNIRRYLKQLVGGNRRYRAILFVDEIEKAFAGSGTDLSGVKTGMTGTWCTWCTDSGADGVLMLGVPGAGKTLIAKWAGSIANIPVIMMDFAGMQSGIIGSTEERLRRGFATVDGIAQGPVLILGTCNSIGQMPPEVLRRFNRGKFFFDLMSETERAACWKFYRGKFAIDPKDKLPNDDNWTGSEVKECAEMASQLNMSLGEASEYIVPVMRSDGEKIKAVRQFATGKYISASRPGVYSWVEEEPARAAGVRRLG